MKRDFSDFDASALVSLKDSAELLLSGAVGVIPTDTVYGLAACASDHASVARLYSLKHRENKPGTIIAANVEQLKDLGFAQNSLNSVSRWWPNPISFVLPAGDKLAYLHLGRESLALRIPDDKHLKQILLATGPLVTSSANQPGEPEATNVAEAWKYFGNSVDFYVDGGDSTDRLASTIVKFHSDGQLELLRQGAIKFDTRR